MSTSDLRRRISIQARTATQDSFGQQLSTWSDMLASVPASIQSLSGRELQAAQAINAEITHQLVLRYHPLLADPVKTSALRAVYVDGAGNTHTYNLYAVSNKDERNRTIEIMAAEGLNPG